MTIHPKLLRPACVACGLAISTVSFSAPPAPWSPGKKANDSELSLAPAGEPGKPFTLEGRILGLPDSLPVRDATVYLYHSDAHGGYSLKGERRPRLAGTAHTNAAGGYISRWTVYLRRSGKP